MKDNILNLKPQVRFADKQVCHKVAEQHLKGHFYKVKGDIRHPTFKKREKKRNTRRKVTPLRV